MPSQSTALRVYRCLCIALSLALLARWCPTVAAQPATAPGPSTRAADRDGTAPLQTSPGDSEQPRQLAIITLKNARADEVASAVRQVFSEGRGPDAQVVAETRTNAVIVNAAPEVIDEIKKLISSLDDLPADEPERHVKIFQLLHIAPSPSLLKMLMTAVDNQTRLSVDDQRKVVVAAGSPASLEVIEAMLKRLDESAPSASERAKTTPREMQIRLVWLVGDLDDSKSTEPPSDLDKVLRELEKVGVVNLKMAAQIVVNAMDGQQFRASGSASVMGPCRLDMSGAVGITHSGQWGSPSRSDQPTLQLEISATGSEGRGASTLCQLDTSISAPLGQSVVLGVTPIQSKPSVFVVQMIPRIAVDAEK